MKGAVAFRSPEELAVTLERPIGFVAGTLILRFSGGEAYPMLQESEEQ